MTEPLDLLVFAAHPDDAELSAGGTLIKHLKLGYRTGIIDLTRGELGTRGSVELRAAEAAAATRLLGLSVRENLGFPDGFFEINQANKLILISKIRQYQPHIIIANALSDRHTDHGRAGTLVSEACFLAGLRRVETTDSEGKPQEPFRPQTVYRYIQDRYIKPDFVVDISDFWEQKMLAVQAFGSQFYSPGANEPETPISTPHFMRQLEARGLELGRSIGVLYGEGFNVERNIGIDNLFTIK